MTIPHGPLEHEAPLVGAVLPACPRCGALQRGWSPVNTHHFSLVLPKPSRVSGGGTSQTLCRRCDYGHLTAEENELRRKKLFHSVCEARLCPNQISCLCSLSNDCQITQGVIITANLSPESFIHCL